MTEILYRSDMSVQLVASSADDLRVVQAARVSTRASNSFEDAVQPQPGSTEDKLIRYLMRSRHGCYDDTTEVLVRTGWKPWPAVDGSEEFLTVDPVTGVQAYQRASRVIHRPWSGDMIRITGASIDLVVTPDHRMLSMPRTRQSSWGLHPASDFEMRSHRIPLGHGQWPGENTMDGDRAMLLGFFIGDGNANGSSLSFRLRRPRKIRALRNMAGRCGFELHEGGNDRFTLRADAEFGRLAKATYDDNRDRVIPQEALDLDWQTLVSLLQGLLEADGHQDARDRTSFSTVSAVLRDQVQEVAAKIGAAATWRRVAPQAGHFGSRPVYQMTLYRARNLTPRIGWTTADRRQQVTREHYEGEVHCVTVPNGTLYVRRNGMPAWCGNSPFEHAMLTFLIEAPIFVWREFMRHRIASYSEESARYRQLAPVFYVPGEDRALCQTGKAAHPTFVAGTAEQAQLVQTGLRRTARIAYGTYETLLSVGVAREVARMVLPLSIYSSAYVSMNPRALMNFLSLRTERADAHFPSAPMREIAMVAEQMEACWKALMPLTHQAFDDCGRVAP